MGRWSSRFALWAICAYVFFAIAASAIGVAGVLSVRSATAAGNVLAHDELSTAIITSELRHQLDTAHATGLALALVPGSARRPQWISELLEQQIPATEASLADLQRIHEGDDARETAGIAQLSAQWATFRGLLNAAAITSIPDSDPTIATRLDAAYQPLNEHLGALSLREARDALDDQARASADSTGNILLIVAAVVLAVIASISLGWAAGRRLRRAIDPARDQVEFGDTLQMAGTEDEAHHLLQRHLQRLVGGADVTVLNRNNSVDRLEAITRLPADSPLVQSLARAEPRSCLAVRSARDHDEDDRRPALLGCPVCESCPGKSMCTPLTVGGEVIGSVLVNRATRYEAAERQRIRDAVAQAAPVLANLRNLAIAELRAATDSLTGLPNKRAVGDTLRRMLAQASRTLTPMTLLMLDLDHFKEINDRFGHPTGDQALASVGAALRSAIRDSDFAGRNGGEEFAVLLPGTDSAGAAVTAEKIRSAISDISLPGITIALTASVGLAAYPEHGTTTERLERLADSALYVAKRSGRDRVEIAALQPDAGTGSLPAESSGTMTP